MKVSATITGTAELERALKRMSPAVEAALQKALEAEAERLHRMTRKQMPVATGQLQRSGKVQDCSEKKNPGRLVWYQAPHGLYVRKARGVLRRALKKRRAGIRIHCIRAVQKALGASK